MSNPSSTVPTKSAQQAGAKPVTPRPAPTPLTQEQQQQVGGAGGRTGLPKGGW